jgi:citrate lyase subunit beta/citryl-CoA lyase
MRSFLFVPGDSERKFLKASQGEADALILDLEDAVAADAKPQARQTTAAMLRRPRDRQSFYVRVNALDTGMTLTDLAAVMPAAPDGIVLPKCRGGDDVRQLALYLDAFEAANGLVGGGTRIIVIASETAESVFGLGSYRGSSPRLWGLLWGAEDLSASLVSSVNRVGGAYTSPYELARNLCLMGAAAAEVAAIDAVYVDIENIDGLAEESRQARRDGFTAKAVIHPKHVDIVNQAFTPTPEEVAWARTIVDAFAALPHAGVFRLGGQMIDKPHLRRARAILGQ